MKTLDPNSTLAELVLESPARTGPLDMLGLDYCCVGEQSLAIACSQRGLDTEAVVEMLNARNLSADEDEIDLKRQSVSELCELLERRWHANLLTLLDGLQCCMDRVTRAHRLREPRLARTEAVFGILDGELRAQISMERRKLLPLLRAFDNGTSLSDWLVEDFEEICRELSRSRATVARSLVVLRGLTNGFKIPSWAGRETRALYEGLRELSALTRYHAHAENNALIPQARRLLQQNNESESTQDETTN